MKIYLKTGTEWKLFEGDDLSSVLKFRKIIIGERAIIAKTLDCIVLGPIGSRNAMMTA